MAFDSSRTLADIYSSRPTNDIAGIMRLLFAFQHASSERSGRAAFLDGWLVLREISPDMAMEGAPLEECRALYQRYLNAESEGLDWSQVSASWEALSRLGWPEHPAFRELSALVAHAEGKDPDRPPIPAHFHAQWVQTERRIHSKETWRCTVSRLGRCCGVPNCPLENRIDPTKSALSQLHPVICRGCGAVLVPDRLAQAFEDAQ
jgi:hypothetical protein